MEWRIEDVERPVTELVVRELRLLVDVLLVHYDERALVWGGSDRVVDDSTVQHGLWRKQLGELANIAASGSNHSATRDAKSRGVGEDGGLHRQLRGVCERGDL